MGYWDKVGSMKKLILFAKNWRTLDELRDEFGLTPAESWKLFRRVVKKYDDFMFKDVNGFKAGCPVMFKATEKSIKEVLANNDLL